VREGPDIHRPHGHYASYGSAFPLIVWCRIARTRSPFAFPKQSISPRDYSFCWRAVLNDAGIKSRTERVDYGGSG